MTPHVIGQINQLSTIPLPALILPLNLVGHIEGWHLCAKTGLLRKVFSHFNSIHTELKAIVRDNMNSPTDFALDNFFAVDGQIYGGDAFYGEAADPAGKDGIIVYDGTNDKYLTIVTTVHPSVPSGS